MSWKGLMPRTVERAGIIVEGQTVSIPYRRPDGTVFRWRQKRSALEGWGTAKAKEWWSEGSGIIPYGLETLPNAISASRSKLLVCEGESDTLALRQALIAPDVYVLGSPGAHSWQEEWEVYVCDFQLVVVIGDGDYAGNAFVERTREMIRGAVGFTCPRGEDVRSLLQENGTEWLNQELAEIFELDQMLRTYFPAMPTPRRPQAQLS